ncbi:myosin light chain kinase, putative [Entamoeba histolytica KU27]|uniref:Myosin light chain kinase, putative n=1 Tax=Entamoeba histolytica KU27 TaxID=885311 RepID=M2S3Y4_ENTHI|nr:myosin light chain kinase, putative [Entamoeba histolytica KU27]
MSLKLASKTVIDSFHFDQTPIYVNRDGELVVNRAVRRMNNDDLCQFMIYRIQTDINHSSLNTSIQAKVEILKINQLHIYNDKTIMSKIPTLREKDHPYVLKCCGGFFASPYNTLEYWMICEYSTNTTLFSYMKKNEPFFFDEVMTIAYQLVKIMNYAYIEFRQTYIHLIPQNIFLGRNPSSPFPQAKLSPYAFIPHKGYDDIEELPFVPVDYMSGIRAELVSTWSFGVILYRMITGYIPQHDENGIILPNELSHIESVEAVDLIRQCINIPFKRPSVESIRGHPLIRLCRQHTKLPHTNNDYTIISTIGRGQFGSVLLAVNKYTGEQVAIKESFGPQNTFLQKDARTMMCCLCQQLVPFLGYFELPYSLSSLNDNSFSSPPELHCYLVMEYCDGGNLEEFIMKFPGLLPDIYIKHFLGDIALGLRYLHFTKGLVHRDLKPENFVLCTQSKNGTLLPGEIPRIKITDYGFSRAILDDKIASEKGTLLFEAPEILRHEGYYTSKTDLYSVGVIIYHLVTKTWPFGCSKESFFEEMAKRSSLKFPNTIIIEKSLKDLMIRLITHEENERIGWKEFFLHPYVRQCLELKGVSMDFNRHEIYSFN